MDGTVCFEQLELFEVGRQQVTVSFDGGSVVSDAGLLPIRQLDQELGILAEAARRIPDPRSQLFITHSAEQLLTQQVYQILAGYPDGNDAQLLRDDPLFKTIVGVDPRDEDRPLASGSTVNRFQHAYTRREAQKPLEERDVIFEVRAAQIGRIHGLNEFLVDVFVRTRKVRPERIVIDLDPTDDPTHGQQQLALFHGYYDQHQYFPMLIFDGESGLPLGAWLRPGTLHASCGAVDMLRGLVDRLRQHWSDIEISVRGDSGVAVPEMYDYCEAEGLFYTFGYATNEVLKRRVREEELEENARLLWWMAGRRPFQMFHDFTDYQAGSWPHPRHIVTKVEITRTGGTNIRHVITNMSGHACDIYHGFYTQRGNVPERPIGELKNGLNLDRLSSHRFLANAQKLMTHVLAYLLYALFREANAETPELKAMEVGTARVRLFKVGAVLKATHRRIWLHVASQWPGRHLLTRAIAAVAEHARALLEVWRGQHLFVHSEYPDPRDRHRIHFAPLPLK
jgi:DDE family transposase